MDEIQGLLREATDLELRLRQADMQSWGARVENMLSALMTFEGGFEQEASGSVVAHFGYAFTAMFLLGGVQGLPPIDHKDAVEWTIEWKNANPGSWKDQVKKLTAVLLRKNYEGARGVGVAIYKEALQFSGAKKNEAAAEDLISTTFMEFLGEGLGEGIHGHIGQAISYVQTNIKRKGLNIMKKDQKSRSMTRGPGEEDEGLEHDLVDHTPNLDVLLMKGHSDPLYKKLWDIIFTDPKLKSELEHIHPDALQYLHIVGHDPSIKDTQILGVNMRGEEIGTPMLAHPFGTGGKRLTPANWNAKKQKMFETIVRHFKLHGEHEHEVREHMHLAYDYERVLKVIGPGQVRRAYSDAETRHILQNAFTTAFDKGGFDALMHMAFAAEVGAHPFERIDNNRKWVEGILGGLSRTLQLEPKQQARLQMYRDDLRHGR